MITIRLMNHGKEREYVSKGVTLGVSYSAYNLFRRYEEAAGNYPLELLKELESFVCRVFGGAFSEEELRNGYQGSAFRLYPSILQAVVAYSSEAIVNFPEPAMAPGTGTAG